MIVALLLGNPLRDHPLANSLRHGSREILEEVQTAGRLLPRKVGRETGIHLQRGVQVLRCLSHVSPSPPPSAAGLPPKSHPPRPGPAPPRRPTPAPGPPGCGSSARPCRPRPTVAGARARCG